MRKYSLILLAALYGCGNVSQVVQVDSETYMVASHGVPGNGSSAAEKVKAVQAATNYCESRSQTIQVINIEAVDPLFGRAPSADLRFRCIKK